MKKQTFLTVEQAIKKARGKISLRGWVHRIRKQKSMIFLILRDSTNIIQCVIRADKVKKPEFSQLEKALVESSLQLEGTIKKESRAPTGFEVSVSKIKIISFAENYPIKKDQSKELLLDNRHLWIRSRKMAAIMKIRSTVFGAIHEYFRKEKFWEFQSPIIIPGGAEEGPTMFEIKYFDRKMFLAQTWQLYAEAAMFGLEKIYTIAPSFRAETSKTSRHLTEFWHAEMEVAWIGLDKLMDYAEGMIKDVVKKVLRENKEELKLLNKDVKKLQPLIKKKFPRITYDKALELLKKKCRLNIPWGKDLRTVEEEKLMDLYDTPIFVTHYPKQAMAFYKPKDPKNPRTALCFDLLCPEGNGELIGGSVRDENIKELINSLKEKGEDIKDYKYYLDTRKYGSIPHAGFGMGTERLVKYICGLDDIKDAIGFPRTQRRWKP